jgi:hypothetical protein
MDECIDAPDARVRAMTKRPGDRLRIFAALWCCADTMARVVDPLIADLQHEHARAIHDGRVWRSRAIRVAGWIAFAKVIAIWTWTGESAPHRWTSDDRRLLARTLALSAVLIIAFTALNLLTVQTSTLRSSHSTAPRLLLDLIPQALPIAMTVGATLGILFGIGGRVISRRVAEAIVALALIASAISFVNLGWITPAANQAFRVALSGRTDLPKGTPELTLGEISMTIEVVRREPIDPSGWHFGDPARYLRDLRFHYHERLALSFSPVVFAFFALSIAAGGSLKRWALGIAAVAAFSGYYVLLYTGRSLVFAGTVPAYASAWAPNVTFALIAARLTLGRLRARGDYEPAW